MGFFSIVFLHFILSTSTYIPCGTSSSNNLNLAFGFKLSPSHILGASVSLFLKEDK